MCIVYRDSASVGDSLPRQSHEFLQLYLYVISIMRVIGPDPVFALYSYDEGSRETIGTGYGMEKVMRGFGLVFYP